MGFSYFIFRAIGFLHIQSILNIDEHNPWTLLGYTLFPPTLTSGPIQKFQDFQQQVQNPAPLTPSLISSAGYRITRGYFRKIVLAALLNKLAEHLLAMQTMSVYSSVAAIAFLYLYFYYDFAGYSDIAIGFGLLMGIKVPENFRKPFLATTVSEFWRNWHITLADWFRDQLFIPLGGMRGSAFGGFARLFHHVTVRLLAWAYVELHVLGNLAWHGSIHRGSLGEKPVRHQPGTGPGTGSASYGLTRRVAFGAIFFLPMDTTGACSGDLGGGGRRDIAFGS